MASWREFFESLPFNLPEGSVVRKNGEVVSPASGSLSSEELANISSFSAFLCRAAFLVKAPSSEDSAFRVPALEPLAALGVDAAVRGRLRAS